MRLSRSGYLIREGFRSITTHGFMSFATVAIIMACLIIIGSVSLLSVNIDAIIKGLEDQNEVVAFVDETYTQEEAAALESQIAALDNISTVQFVTRTEAMDNFMGNYSKNLMEGIDETVFLPGMVAETLTSLMVVSFNSCPANAQAGTAGKRHTNNTYTISMLVTHAQSTRRESIIHSFVGRFSGLFLLAAAPSQSMLGRHPPVCAPVVNVAVGSFNGNLQLRDSSGFPPDSLIHRNFAAKLRLKIQTAKRKPIFLHGGLIRRASN